MLFNELGRNNPSENCRVFSVVPRTFYKLAPVNVNYTQQHMQAANVCLIDSKLRASEVEQSLRLIRKRINRDTNYPNLFSGPAIPFCFSLQGVTQDLGTQLETVWLPLLKREYEKQVPGTYFKATLQGSRELRQSLSVVENSGYDLFLEAGGKSPVVGYYFPTAFQEFDIQSQRSRTAELPALGDLKICLSGPFEIIYSLVCYPKLLFDEGNYSPILCASALEHSDPRMVMIFKSYGPHLEFWLMSQMLTPSKTQVSEQWSGGITIFQQL